MSLDSDNADDARDEFEDNLEAAQRQVFQIEVDTQRLRSNITRLKAAIEDRKERRGAGRTSREDYVQPVVTTDLQSDASADSWTPDAEPVDAVDAIRSDPRSVESQPLGVGVGAGVDSEIDHAIATEEAPEALPVAVPQQNLRYTTSPVLASFGVHSVVMLAILVLGVATIAHEEITSNHTSLDLESRPVVQAELMPAESFDLGQVAQLDETNLGNAGLAATPAVLDTPIVDDVEPLGFDALAGPASPGDAGVTTALKPIVSDIGTLQPGNGGTGADGASPAAGPGNGKGVGNGAGGKAPRERGPVGSAMFFGAKSKGDRFVFVVDNSSSMKNGRLEFAVAELVKTVASLSPKQSFYVIFVSDQTYPMFYPNPAPDLLPATPLNKKQLADWLPKAILASGKNREMIKAMDLAASLRPHAVYLLWDGDMRYSETVRLDVMTHLTSPANGWNFTIHTIGLGVTAPDAEQNLTSIAEAHGGMYRRIAVPKK